MLFDRNAPDLLGDTEETWEIIRELNLRSRMGSNRVPFTLVTIQSVCSLKLSLWAFVATLILSGRFVSQCKKQD